MELDSYLQNLNQKTLNRQKTLSEKNKRRRNPLSEKNENSDADNSTNESPKRQCLDTIMSPKKNFIKKDDLQIMDNSERNNSSSDPNKTAETAEYLRDASADVPSDRKTRLALLAASINQWEDESSHSLTNIQSVTKKKENSTINAEFTYNESKLTNRKVNNPTLNRLKNSNESENIRMSTDPISDNSNKKQVRFEDDDNDIKNIRSHIDSTSSMDSDNFIPDRVSDDKPKKVNIWDKHLVSSLEAQGFTKTASSSKMGFEFNTEKKGELNKETKGKLPVSSVKASSNETCAKVLKKPDVKKEEHLPNSTNVKVDPAELPLSARRAFFETIFCKSNENQQPSIPSSVAERAALFEKTSVTSVKSVPTAAKRTKWINNLSPKTNKNVEYRNSPMKVDPHTVQNRKRLFEAICTNSEVKPSSSETDDGLEDNYEEENDSYDPTNSTPEDQSESENIKDLNIINEESVTEDNTAEEENLSMTENFSMEENVTKNNVSLEENVNIIKDNSIDEKEIFNENEDNVNEKENLSLEKYIADKDIQNMDEDNYIESEESIYSKVTESDITANAMKVCDGMNSYLDQYLEEEIKDSPRSSNIYIPLQSTKSCDSYSSVSTKSSAGHYNVRKPFSQQSFEDDGFEKLNPSICTTSSTNSHNFKKPFAPQSYEEDDSEILSPSIYTNCSSTPDNYKTKSVMSFDDDDIPLSYSVSFYKNQNVCRTPVTALRQKSMCDSPSSPELTEKTLSIQDRIKALQEDTHIQQTVINQTSHALNLCHSTVEFVGSLEQVEAERLLLIATQKKQAALNEIQRLKTEGALGKNVDNGRGTLVLTDIRLPLKRDFLVQKMEGKSEQKLHYFICIIRQRSQVVTTQMLSTEDGITAGTLCFTNHMCFNDLGGDFNIFLEVYALQTKKENMSHEKKYHIKKENRLRLTPKSKRPGSKHQSPAISSPGVHGSVRSPGFSLVGSICISLNNYSHKSYRLEKVPLVSPLEGVLLMKTQISVEQNVEEKGFLNMFEEVGGFGAWNRRWCVLKGNTMAFWKYPDEEDLKEPLGLIDLCECVTDNIGLTSWDVCARRNTFQLILKRPARKSDKSNLVRTVENCVTTTNCLLSAESKEERILWCNSLNTAVSNIRQWTPQNPYFAYTK